METPLAAWDFGRLKNWAAAMHPFGTNVRASNSIGYFTPNLGGFSANLMWATGEQKVAVPAVPAAAEEDGNYAGLRIAYASGPLSVAGATGKTNYSTGDYTQSNFGANYQFGPAKLMYLWGQNKVGVTKTNINMFGTQWAVGPGQLRFAYTVLTASGGTTKDANQVAIGYVYDLSKRTALYSTYSRVNNKSTGKTFFIGGGSAPTDAGGSSSGLEFGLRHTF
jgi:predicted porin